MGNTNSSLSQTRPQSPNVSNHEPNSSMSEAPTTREPAVRERESSSGSSPRKRNRFSSLRNPFKSKTDPDMSSRERRTDPFRERQSRDAEARKRHFRSHQDGTQGSTPALAGHNPSFAPQSVLGSPAEIYHDSATEETSYSSPQAISNGETGTDMLSSDSLEELATPFTDPITTRNNSEQSSSDLSTGQNQPNTCPETVSTTTSESAPANSNLPEHDTIVHDPEHSLNLDSVVAAQSDTTEIAQTDTPSSELVSPMPGEDQASMLARLLSVAAAATAASLVGHNNRHALRDAREVSAASSSRGSGADRPGQAATASSETDLVDGSFDGFLSALQSGRLAQALRQGESRTDTDQTPDLVHQPLNFFRMFRFSEPINDSSSPTTDGTPGARMIPIIIVGIRSVPARDTTTPAREAMPSFFGALQSLGRRRSADVQASNASDNRDSEHAPMPSEEANVTHRQPIGRASSSGTLEDQSSGREQPSVVPDTSRSNRMDDTRGSQTADGLERLMEDSGRGLAGHNGNSRSNSTSREGITGSAQEADRPASGVMESVLDRLRSFRSENASQSSLSAESVRRRRRRSAWRPFASANRSEGDLTDSSQAAPRQGNSSSFLVYVLGGSYPEDHPILTTPSLFTDTPSYEDMLLLTSLIGPAKPETAEANDLDNAGPVYQVEEHAQELQSRCDVCLMDYEVGDQCRKLLKCSHYFHKDCIDEWLTTGRNNCPMCRTDTGAQTSHVPEPAVDPQVEPVAAPVLARTHDPSPLGPVLELH